MKLRKLLKDRFCAKYLQQNPTLANNFKILDLFLDDVFPSQNIINNVIGSLTPTDRNFNFNYNVRCLPFRTRDTEWLTNYMGRAISQLLSLKHDEKNNKDLLPFRSLDQRNFFYSPYVEALPVKNKHITKYIKYSPKFADKRDEFECNLTLGYLANLMNQNSYDFYLTAEEKDNCFNSVDCDKIFRNAVVDAMHSLGVSKENTEASLELNAHLWRKSMICRAFYNSMPSFTPDEICYLKAHDGELYRNLMDKENQCLKLFVRLREDEYCRKHKGIMQKVGLTTKGLELTPAQLKKLTEEKVILDRQYEIMKNKAVKVLQNFQIQVADKTK